MNNGIALLCFFFSGAAALIFEQVWARSLSLVFGTSALALSTVLASLMGGLALGGFLGGRLADRLRRPLLWYAACEIGTAISGLAVPWLLGSREFLARLGGDDFFLASLARFAAATAMLIVPATLMGASLPMLARYIVRHEAHARKPGARIGLLYGANTAGAVVGACVAGFALLPWLGGQRTNLLAAALDLAVAALVLVLSRRPERPATGGELLEQLSDEPAPVVSKSAARWAILAYALSGAAAMALEVLWTRALSMVIGSSVYSFTIILVAFLAGISVGALAAARFVGKRARTADPLLWLAVLAALTAGAVLATTALIDRLPSMFLGMLRTSSFGADTILGLHFVVAAIAVLPPAFFMGAFFPITMQTVAGRLDAIGRETGRVYAWNTVGAILGSFLGGFVLLRFLGLRTGLLCAASTYALIAAALWLIRGIRSVRHVALASSLLVLWAALVGALPAWDRIKLTVGYFRISLAREYIEDPYDRPELLFYEDGLSTTVTVERWGKDLVALKNNGKVDASSRDDMPTQIMVGALPLLLHPEYGQRPLKVLLIGFASGATAGAILQGQIERLDVVELEEATLRASRFFDDVNHRPLEDPRVRVFIDDGRNYLLRTTERYDVIVSEPSNPWIAGVANLFTVEYFRLARTRLQPSGIFCSWAQLYEMAPLRIKSVYRAFAEAFDRPHAFAAEDLSSDTFLIAGQSPVLLDLDRLRRSFSEPRLGAELRRAGLRSPHDIPAFLLIGPDEMRAFVAGVTPNTDDNALVEFGAPRDLYAHRQHDSYVSRVYGRGWAYGRLDELLAGWESGDAPNNFGELAHALVRHGRRTEAERFAVRARGAGAKARRLLAWIEDRPLEDPEVPLAPDALIPPALASLPADEQRRLALDYTAIERHLEAKRFAKAYQLLDAWPQEWREQAGPDLRYVWGFLEYKLGNQKMAARILQPLAADETWTQRRPNYFYYLGRSLYRSADYAKGTDALERWMESRVDTVEPAH